MHGFHVGGNQLLGRGDEEGIIDETEEEVRGVEEEVLKIPRRRGRAMIKRKARRASVEDHGAMA